MCSHQYIQEGGSRSDQCPLPMESRDTEFIRQGCKPDAVLQSVSPSLRDVPPSIRNNKFQSHPGGKTELSFHSLRRMWHYNILVLWRGKVHADTEFRGREEGWECDRGSSVGFLIKTCSFSDLVMFVVRVSFFICNLSFSSHAKNVFTSKGDFVVLIVNYLS